MAILADPPERHAGRRGDGRVGGVHAPVAAERTRVVTAADRFLGEPPVTVTATRAPRSAGGPHDFFSEGDYWWPDPANPGGPCVQRDGMTNPDNFTAHRHAMMRLSVQVPAVDPSTRMNPSLLYAQAIHGRATGIIDTIHLVEAARAIEMLEGAPGWTSEDDRNVRGWFRDRRSGRAARRRRLDAATTSRLPGPRHP
ncbi:MAG: alginate lyase family protein [Acidobacteria bacterium]|nr:alginate lyase family protein [Acidobacteriota bacterium]